jgi:FixJ family two-component response regulator
MPSISGLELAERISRVRPDVQVLFMSGYPEGALGHEITLPTGTSFVQKPLTPNVVLTQVREVLDRARPLAAPGPQPPGAA